MRAAARRGHPVTTTAFSRTYARLLDDRGRSTAVVMAGAGLVLAAWGWWATHVPVTLYEISTAARIELGASTSPVQSPLVGRIVTVNLQVGQVVRRGDVLVEIDAAPEALQLRQEQVRTQGIEPELMRLRSELAAEDRARAEEQRTARVSAEEATSRIREAEADAHYAEGELARVARLHGERLIADHDLEKAKADAQRLRAAVTALESAARRVPQEQTTRDRERDVRIERLRSQMASLDAQRRTLTAGIERLGYEIERRRVRAPVDGTVGESATLRTGGVVQEGEKLASIIPSGRLIVAAQFPADAAFGRIRPGQAATLRLDGFPWSEFGSVSATVVRVAHEIRDGSVRIELTIDSQSTFRGTLEHGMPGVLEVAVERLTPLALVLRTAGQALTARR
jgi:multidrug resistance efflux pump